MLRLTRLDLTDFRNYPTLTWRPGARISVVTGPNGSGKTNVLEAVSLLTPGRGLRGARHAEYPRQNGHGGWAVAGRLNTVLGESDIGTGTPPDGNAERRVFRLDGATPRSQGELAHRIAAVWLTPQMDRLFGQSASGRRRFLDRLVWALEPAHAREITAHDTAMAGRNRLLARQRQGEKIDPAWLAGVEDTIARHAVAAAAARAMLAERLNASLQGGAVHDFPPARLVLKDEIADRLAQAPAVAVEDWLRTTLAADRRRDTMAGSTRLGAHRADMDLTDAQTGLSASMASTGQQKAMLIGVILGHAALIGESRGFAPLLLLDEPAVHLDADRRAALFEALLHTSAQVVLTGTDADIFYPLRTHATGWRVRDGFLTPDDGFMPPNPAGRAIV